MEGSTESMFEIGDKVVYGVVGVCEVENIDTPPIKGISGDYYFLQPVFDSKLIHLIRALYVIKNERAKDLRKMKSADSRMLIAARKLLYGEFAAVYNQNFDDVAEEMDAFLSVD